LTGKCLLSMYAAHPQKRLASLNQYTTRGNICSANIVNVRFLSLFMYQNSFQTSFVFQSTSLYIILHNHNNCTAVKSTYARYIVTSLLYNIIWLYTSANASVSSLARSITGRSCAAKMRTFSFPGMSVIYKPVHYMQLKFHHYTLQTFKQITNIHFVLTKGLLCHCLPSTHVNRFLLFLTDIYYKKFAMMGLIINPPWTVCIRHGAGQWQVPYTWSGFLPPIPQVHQLAQMTPMKYFTLK